MMIRVMLPLLAAGLMAASTAHAQNVFDYPQADDAPASFHVVNEIPAGSFTKYEIDAEHGQLIVDRYSREQLYRSFSEQGNPTLE